MTRNMSVPDNWPAKLEQAQKNLHVFMNKHMADPLVCIVANPNQQDDCMLKALYSNNSTLNCKFLWQGKFLELSSFYN